VKDEASRWKTLSPLLWIILGAILVRFIGLTRESFWNDETYTGYLAQLPSLKQVLHFISYDVHPPGYFSLVWGWGRLFGMSDYSLRATSAVAGVLLVPVAYRIGKQLFDAKTGMISAFISAFIFQSIYYSQELRAYIFLALLSALSVTILLDCLHSLEAQEKQSPWRYFGLLLVCGLNGYFHYFGLMFSALVAATFVIYAFRFRRQRKIALLFGAGFFAMYLPWLPVALHSVNRTSWMQRPDARFVIESANIFYGPGRVLDAIVVGVILCGFGYALFKKGWKGIEAGDRWLLAWIFVPLAISVSISLTVRPVYSPRNLLIAGVAAWILLARAITLLPWRSVYQWGLAIGVLAICHVLQIVSPTHGYFVKPTKQQFREAAAYVATHNTERLPIYAIDWDTENYAYYLSYVHQDGLIKTLSDLDIQSKGLRALIGDQRFWLATGGLNVYDFDDLNQGFRVIDQAHFLLADVYLVERK